MVGECLVVVAVVCVAMEVAVVYFEALVGIGRAVEVVWLRGRQEWVYQAWLSFLQGKL